MKKIMIFLLLATLLVVFSGCVDVNPGYVCVRVWKRGSDAGKVETLGTGRHNMSMRASDFMFPTFKQNYVWTASKTEGSRDDESITFPIEGLRVNVDVGVEFSVDPENVSTIFSEYRKDLTGITSGPMRNYIRDTVLSESQNYLSMEQFITNNQISSMIDSVEAKAMSYFKPKGIVVSNIYLVDSPRYPRSVTDSIEEKIKATQQAIQRENELRTAEAAAKKQVAQAQGAADAMLATAKAQAESNRLKQRSLTPNIIKAMYIDKWDGVLPRVSSDAGMILSLDE